MPTETTWRCKCGWTGTNPSMSDASHVRMVCGQLISDRVHFACCPECFAAVRSVAAAERTARVITGTGNASEQRELNALCRGLRVAS